MSPNEREDTSRYVSEPRREPAPVEEQPVRTAPPEQKPKKGKGRGVLIALLLLAILAAAALGWLWYQQNGRVNDLEADLSVARNDVSRLESVAKANATLDAATADDAVTSDTSTEAGASIIEAAMNYSEARTGNSGFMEEPAKREAKIAKQTTEFAKVVVSSPDTSGIETVYLKSNKLAWVVIGDGTEDKTMLQSSYGLPKDF